MNEPDKKPLDHPTGFVSTTLPFWEKLDDGEFEQFCTDWLNFHPILLCQRNGKVEKIRVVNASRLLSGTSQRGADIRVEMENGEVWILQCKLVKEFYPSDVQAAISLAEKQNPDASQYVLVTTCGLSDAAQQEIANSPKWFWWDSSRLTTEAQKIEPVENGMKLVHKFFGAEWVKLLFPWGANVLIAWQEYFAQDLSSERRLFHHRGEFLIWGDILARLQTFARDGAGRALVLSGGGGQGKSRLLLELAKALEGQPDMPRVKFLRIGGKSLGDEGLDLISREKSTVLVVEDAHRLDTALGQVAIAAACATSVRLLVATRPQAREAVTSELARHGYAERLEPPLNLPRWKQADVQALAEKILSPSHQLQAPHLAAIADRCPLLVVLGGALINAGTIPEAMTNEVLFRERVFKGFLDEFLRLHEGQRRQRLSQLIRILAFIGPTAKNDSLFAKAGEILGCSALDIADDIEVLNCAGLLAENREGIRIYPDLFSDAVLLDACLDSSGQASFLYKTIIAKLPATDFPALLRNLAQADWEARSKRGSQDSFFDPIWMEFARRFQDANWGNREKMLRQWAPFAPFQPDRTLELARLAINTPEPQRRGNDEAGYSNGDQSYMLKALPLVLKPLVMWHPDHSNQALDILWSLESDRPQPNNRSDESPIGTIASAGSFEVQSHHGPHAVMAWLENVLPTPHATDRIKQQPWILETVLAPFFARVVEQSWWSGRMVTFRAVPLSADATRPLRKRALALADKFATSPVPVIARAGIKVLQEAIRGVESKFGYQPGPVDYERWRPDRLEGIAAMKRAISANVKDHIALLKVRGFLSRRAEYDQDEIIGDACRTLLSQMTDSFELRLARVLTSWSHDEFRVRSGPNCDADLREADRQWNTFCRNTAAEAAERCGTATQFCELLKTEAAELSNAGFSVQPHGMIVEMAMVSPVWSASLLHELSTTSDSTLDPFLSAVLKVAVSKSPDEYQKAMNELPRTARPSQVASVVDFISWKHQLGGGLTAQECDSLELCACRPESQIVQGLAFALGHHFSAEPKWPIDLLSRLKAGEQKDGGQILQALAQIIEKQKGSIEASTVSHCLSNVGVFCDGEDLREERSLERIAAQFPVPIYEHFRFLVDSAPNDEASTTIRIGVRGLPSLGAFGDAAYVDNEIENQWSKVQADAHTKDARIALIRALIWSDSTAAETRMQRVIFGCENGGQLHLAVELFATRGSRFVFRFPNLVRELLSRAADFGVKDKILRELWASACGGGRSWTNNQLDPQFHYIRKDAERLAVDHGADPILSQFYKMIVQSEDREAEMNRRMFGSGEEELE